MSDDERRAVECLVDEARRLHDESRYAGALRVAERAIEGARRLGDVGLEVRAATVRADVLKMRGELPAALEAYSWLLRLAQEPARVDGPERASTEGCLLDAHDAWVSCARRLTETPLAQLLSVLDAGEAFARRIGRPTWRAGLLRQRAMVLGQMGRTAEALGFAEEGLALRQRCGVRLGATLASHHWGLAELLRRVGRHADAATHYQAVLDDPASRPGDRSSAHRGLAHCSLEAADVAAAVAHAERAVRLAEGLGDNEVSYTLDTLVEAYRAAGDLLAARAAADRLVDVVRRVGKSGFLYFALRASVKVALDEGDGARARALLDQMTPLAHALDRQRDATTFRNEIAGMCRGLDKARR
jgi:tetratricopeptide (TPR) repeat protein